MNFFTNPRLLVLVAVITATLLSATSAARAQDDEEEFTQTSRSSSAQDDVAKAIEAFNRGQDAHSKGELDRALALYEEALRLLPEFPEAEYQVGAIHESRGYVEKAEASYRRALESRPEWTLPASALGRLLVSKGALGEAKALLEETIDRDGMCIPCYPALTDAYLRSGSGPEELRTLLQKLSILTAKTKIPASIWAAKAAIERASKDLDSAAESVRRGILIDKEDPSILSEQIEVLILKGDSEGAVKSAKRLTVLIPDSVPARIQLARAEHAAGRTDAAVSILEALEGSGDAKNVLAAIRDSSEDDPGRLLKLLDAEPENASILARLCAVYRTSAPEQALSYCLRASQAEPSNLGHAVGYAAALLQTKNYPAAAALLTRLKEAAPDNFTVRANLATALFQLERFEPAIEEYLWITVREPELPAAYYFLGISYDRTERYVEALAAYQRFLSLADEGSFTDEIGRVELRLPVLQRQIKSGKGRN